MTRKLSLPLLCAATLLTAPLMAKLKVQTQHQANNDCKQYKTYQWLPVKTINKSGIHENDEIAAPVIKAVRRVYKFFQGSAGPKRDAPES